MAFQRSELTSNQGFFSPPVYTTQHLVFGLDIDGTTDTILARNKLSDDIAQFVVNHPELESIDFIISSLRQSFMQDYYNAAIHNPRDELGRTQSCTVLSEGFIRLVEQKIQAAFVAKKIQRPSPTLHFRTLLTSDIFNDLPDGTTLEKIAEFHHYACPPAESTEYITVADRRGSEVSVALYDKYRNMFEFVGPEDATHPSFEFCDTSKILLLWIQMQYFASLYGKDTLFVFRFVDDKLEVIAEVTQFFRKNRHLMPSNCRLECQYMSSNHHHYPPEYKVGQSIRGIGLIHANFRQLASRIAASVDAKYTPNEELAKTSMIKDLLYLQFIQNASLLRAEEMDIVNDAAILCAMKQG